MDIIKRRGGQIRWIMFRLFVRALLRNGRTTHASTASGVWQLGSVLQSLQRGLHGRVRVDAIAHQRAIGTPHGIARCTGASMSCRAWSIRGGGVVRRANAASTSSRGLLLSSLLPAQAGAF